MKKNFFKRIFSIMLAVSISSTIAFSASAESYYVGTVKKGFQSGISAYIKPTRYPNVKKSGESCWVSNVINRLSGIEWVQAGLRYYYVDTGMVTYYETKISGVYNLQEVGYHVLDFSAQYKVEYQSDGMWHAYIGPYDQGGFTLQYSGATVQAQAEAHASDIELGPFEFTSVKYKNSSGTWLNMDVTPEADSPFNVSIINDYTYTAY